MRSSRVTEPGAEADARKHLNIDTVAGGIGFAFAFAYLAAAFTIPEGSFSNAAVGPAALPIVIGAARRSRCGAFCVERPSRKSPKPKGQRN